MGFVWIASYPKSGNTWVRFLLANYIAGPISTSAQVEDLIPAVDRIADGEAFIAKRSVVYSKTHFVWGPSHPFARLTDKAVVVIRNPKDVLLSNLNYMRIMNGDDRGFSDAEFAASFIREGGVPLWSQQGYGTLDENCSSWLDGGGDLNRLVIRYEDLKADPEPELKKIVSFLELPMNQERIRSAVERSSFDRMRAMEVREKSQRRQSLVFPGKGPRPGWARFFMNRGSMEASLARVNAALDRQFDHAFDSLLSRLGYSAPRA